jgi:hypothetical protein
MTDLSPWTRSTWTDAAQLAESVHPDKIPDGAAGQLPHQWYGALVAGGRLFEATEFLAHALPRYECAVWATQALLEMDAADRHDPLMVAVLRWIDEPSDALRRAVGEVIEATRRDSPAKMLAQAVLLSGGSLAPEDMPAVLPPPDVCAKLAAGAVISGAYTRPDPDAAMQKTLVAGEAMAAGR